MNEKPKARVAFTVKLLLVILPAILISCLLLGIVTYRIASKGMTESVTNHFSAISEDIANQISAINENEFGMLRALAEIDFIKDEDVSLEEKTKQLSHIAAAKGGNCENIAFYDEEGNAITTDGRHMNFAKRPYFSEAIAGKNFVSDPTFSTVTNSILQHYSVPVYNKEGKAIGVVVMVISGNRIQETISAIDLGDGMHPSVINYKTETTVANANEGTDENDNSEQELDYTQGLGLVLANIFEGKEDIDDFVDPNIHMHLLASYKRVENTDWTVLAVAPYNYYFHALKTMKTGVLVVTILVILLSTLVTVAFIGLLIKPLKEVKTSITKIASGNADLTQRIPETSNDEIGDVVKGFNGFVEKLQVIVTNFQGSEKNLKDVDAQLQNSTQDAESSIAQILSNIDTVNTHVMSQADYVQETAGAVNEISSNIESLEKMIEFQSSNVSDASSAVEQMIGNINSVNHSVGLMIESFNQLKENSNSGTNTQTNANEKIKQIEAQSKMLQDANVAIANIAEQTNLLAMNAAIEAAHAGEAGKGFAVVADEIRKLSETSSSQSKTIGSELQKIQNTIHDVVSVSNATNTAFTAITQSIGETSQIIEQIKSAMEEQQIGSKQIIDSLQAMNNSTLEVKTAASEMTEGNKQILAEVSKLQNATQNIKGSIGEMHKGAKRISDTGSELSDISEKVGQNIKQIGSEIDLFKV
jgi:methyl-accepting chemotaxis protein